MSMVEFAKWFRSVGTTKTLGNGGCYARDRVNEDGIVIASKLASRKVSRNRGRVALLTKPCEEDVRSFAVPPPFYASLHEQLCVIV